MKAANSSRDDNPFESPKTLTRNIHSQIAERIGSSIVKGDFSPGDKVPTEQRICEMMGVSRPVVREAMRNLEAKGLIETRPKSGTRIRDVEHWNHFDSDILRWRVEASDIDSYLRKLLQLRRVLDPEASRLAAENATEADHAQLSSSFAAMCDAKTIAEFVAADVEFHKAIYIATRNEFYWPIARMFELALKPSFDITAAGDHRQRALDEHGVLLDAILRKDGDAAEIAARQLLTQSQRDLEKIRRGGA